ncbi:MAG: hypothetical protein GC201_07350 [Alphaproteobacteria bacterium]|nr:hypothetical protein [Alphaproteobacteria bacterium]
MGPRRWEYAYAVLAVFAACRGLDLLFGWLSDTNGGALDDSNPIRLLALLAIYLVSAVLLLRHHSRDLLAILSQNKLLLLTLLFILASAFWAIEPGTSFRRSSALILSTVFCFYLALRFKPVEILAIAAVALGLVAALSLLAVVAVPSLGVYSDVKAGRWRGIIGINTLFGRMMVLGILIVWALRREQWRLSRYDAVLFLLFVVCALGAQAVTALAACMSGLAGMVLIWTARPRRMPAYFRLAILALVALPAAVVAANFGDVLALVGRDSTLSERVYIWQAAFDLGMQRPWLGAGYRSFWIEDYAWTAYYNMFGSANTEFGNGHNGYLDVWLELGVVGLVLFGLLLTQGFVRLLRQTRAGQDAFGEFYGGLLFFLVVYSVAERVLFEHTELTWMLFTTGLIVLKWRERRSEQPRLLPDEVPVVEALGARRGL